MVYPLKSGKPDDTAADSSKQPASLGSSDRKVEPLEDRPISLQELVAYMVKQLVDNPDKVEVYKIEGAHITVLEVRIEKADAGQVIGRNGRTADALRTILSAVATKNRKRVMLDIID